MELQKIVVLCALVVVIGAGAWFLAIKSDRGTATNNAEQIGSSEVANENKSLDEVDETSLSGQGSLVDLLTLGRSISCTYTYADEAGEGSGTGYFDEGRMRVDTTFTSDGQSFESHVINDGENMYSWTISDEGSFAFVTPYKEYEETDGDFDDMPMHENSGAETLDQRVTYDCDSWRVDESRFTPPNNIEFVDMTAMFEGMMEGMPEGMMENMPAFNH